MTVPAGSRLGPYEIVAPLGAGGMGEVYRARDPKLGREVAIKVLPDELSQDKERLARFEREARLLASLNHPNIATLHGLEDSDSQKFLVMELVSGETLAARIARGAIPAEEAVPLFQQIADGLDAAHEKNVIHRDLKPGNLMVTEEGRIKILDFGLARAGDTGTESPGDGESRSPTLTRGTALGAILGTASYMSPEQARGKAVDRRTDIWAFGCCLYEALTGKRAFAGDTVSDIISSVLRAEPDFDKLRARFRPLVKRCLVKDARQRLRDIGEARIALGSEGVEPPAGEARSTLATALPWAAASLLAAVLVASWLTRAPSERTTVTRFLVSKTMQEQLTSDQGYPLALSPDGTGLAYTARREGRVQIYLRRFDRLLASPIDGTEGATLPFYSPDGKWLGYFARGKLWKVRVEGGAPLALTDAADGLGAAWGDDDNIYFSAGSAFGVQGVQRIPASGGTPEPISFPQKANHRVVSVLPGARALPYREVPGGLAILRIGASGSEPGGQPLTDRQGDVPELVPGFDGADYVSSGHLVFVRADTLMAVPFDLDRLEIVGEPVAIDENVAGAFRTGGGNLASVPFGTDFLLMEVDQNGNARPVTEERHPYEDLSVSPDGRYVATTLFYVPQHVFILDRERDTLSRLSSSPSSFDPVWSPDGAHLYFSANNSIHRIAADGSGEPERTNANGIPTSFTPDGKHLAYFTGGDSGRDLWVLSLEDDGETKPLIQTSADEWSARFSPDGRWLAYVSNETGQKQIYVQAYPGPGARAQVSSDGSDQPMWGPDGSELFYLNGDRMMVVNVTREPSLNVGKPRVLFERPILEGMRSYEVTADGERFITIERDEDAAWQIHVVLNWEKELERLVPAER